MTYSIIAKKGNQYGVGTVTASVAVGGFVPYVEANKIAAATQGFYTNYLYPYWALDLLNKNSVSECLDKVISQDENANFRQFIFMDKLGNTAGWTGDGNDHFCGHILQKNLAVAGNRLVSREVLNRMIETYTKTESQNLVEQIIASLEAGLLAGGDKQGALSIAIRVVSDEHPPCDLRVDYSSNIISEIRKLYSHYTDSSYNKFIKAIPTVNNPSKAG
ncbi:DUF1028 domain-containing protein [Francisella sp. 19X1-34]|uniref:DUF1028 domain-containing protein n=1 Tax=Francisella sp. 19X1-34 TaxID=3087177 RepID=UPI002E35CB1E|nr:DUF1028 domain-containing protein [Francisella sp. 19X1-34]MED7789667.1 DUF1028 domain-containing protein [Francisella sp. 19X1-34]